MYKISEHKDEIITHIIKNAIWLPIASLVPIFLSFVGNIIKNGNNIDKFTIIALSASVGMSIISISVSLKIKKHNSNESSNDRESEESVESCADAPNNLKITPITNVRIESVDTELNFESRTSIVSTLTYNMIANEDDVKYFEKELIWSGKEYNGTKLIDKDGNYELELFDSNDSIHKYRVKFLDNKNRQEKIYFKLETKVGDSGCTMQPISSYMVKHQIDSLTIRVVVPPNLIKNVKKSIYADMARQVPIGERKMVVKRTIAGRECYEVTIPNPTILYRYFLEWEFVTP